MGTGRSRTKVETKLSPSKPRVFSQAHMVTLFYSIFSLSLLAIESVNHNGIGNLPCPSSI